MTGVLVVAAGALLAWAIQYRAWVLQRRASDGWRCAYEAERSQVDTWAQAYKDVRRRCQELEEEFAADADLDELCLEPVGRGACGHQIGHEGPHMSNTDPREELEPNMAALVAAERRRRAS